MAIVVGTVPGAANRSLLGSLKARFSEAGRQQAEFEEGEGLRRLIGLVKGLPDSVMAVVRPTLGFMTVDACVAAPGVLLVINTLHWSGEVAPAETGAWTGANGKVDLGRPDRRAFTFADRLQFSGRSEGFRVVPAVVCTAGPVRLNVKGPEAEVVDAERAAEWLRQATHSTGGPDPAPLVESLLGK